MTTTTYDLNRELDEMAERELARDRAVFENRGPEHTALAPVVDRDDKNLAVLTHLGTVAAAFLSGGLLHVVVPAVAMIALHDKSSFARDHARNQLNFQLTFLAVVAAGIVLSVVTLGLGLVVALPAIAFFWIFDLVNTIRAALAAGRGEHFEFPWSLKLLS
jgi:uncharacterized protein